MIAMSHDRLTGVTPSNDVEIAAALAVMIELLTRMVDTLDRIDQKHKRAIALLTDLSRSI